LIAHKLQNNPPSCILCNKAFQIFKSSDEVSPLLHWILLIIWFLVWLSQYILIPLVPAATDVCEFEVWAQLLLLVFACPSFVDAMIRTHPEEKQGNDEIHVKEFLSPWFLLLFYIMMFNRTHACVEYWPHLRPICTGQESRIWHFNNFDS
jgi:hypothetical protein